MKEMLDRLRELEAAATPPPWAWDAEEWEIHSVGKPRTEAEQLADSPIYDERIHSPQTIVETDCGVYPPEPEDRDLIIEVRNALPALLEYIAGLESLLKARGAT